MTTNSLPKVVASRLGAHLGYLDGLRGLMALWVVIGHACSSTGMNSVPIVRSPKYAVDAFMILSGFLMTYHYQLRASAEPWTSWRTWLAFYVRRFFRIAPLYYVALIPACWMQPQFAAWRQTINATLGFDGAPAQSPVISSENVIVHVTYLFGLLPKYHASLVLPDWSLSLEMQFYLLFPFIMLARLRFGLAQVSLALTAVWLYATSARFGFGSSFVQPSALPLSILWFVIGIVWAASYVASSRQRSRWIGLSACSLSFVSADLHDIVLVFFFGFVIFARGEGAIGKVALRIRSMLSGSVFKMLGNVSYGVYLIHLLILVPIAYFLLTQAHFSSKTRFIVALASTVSISYLVAWGLTRVEELGIKLGKRLSCSVLPIRKGSDGGDMVLVGAGYQQ